MLIYRATRIINFAVGAMGLVGAVTLSLLTIQYHVPFWAAFALALVIGLVFGAIMEIAVVRRLRTAPRVVVLVSTIGIAGLAQTIAVEIPAPTDTSAHYPSAFGGTWNVGSVTIHGSDLSILILAPLAILALSWFLDRTTLGKTVAACATNPWLARLSAVSPKFVSTLVWTLAGGLATLSLVLIGGATSTAAALGNLGPQTLSEALAAAVIASFRSIRIAVLAAVAIGVMQSVLTFNYITVPGVTNVVLLIVVFVAVIFAKREDAESSQVFAFSPRVRPIPQRLRSIWWARNLNKAGLLGLGLLAVLLPLIVTQPSRQQLFTAVLAWAICASSLTVLTGWLGQLSLGQMAFAGLAALFAGSTGKPGCPLLGGYCRDHSGVRTPRPGDGHRVVACSRPVLGRRDVCLRLYCGAVLLLPAFLFRSVSRRCERSLCPRSSLVSLVFRTADLLLPRAGGAGRGPLAAQSIPIQRCGTDDQGRAR